MKKIIFLISISLIAVIRLYSQNTAHNIISINNISARINNNGNLFRDMTGNSGFKVPKTGNAGTIFNSTLWIGGYDLNDSLHFAGERYEQLGHDFWSGPVSNVYDAAYDSKWDKVWKITKFEIDEFRAFCLDPNKYPDYTMPSSISTWPGNGDTTLGQAKMLAPFHDNNGDGIYAPYDCDYPLIKGDQAILFIMNDASHPHTESLGKPFGMDVVVMAYEYACPADSALWNTLFVKYKIINCSDKLYKDLYIGNFTDFDLGYQYDDYIGCDVRRASFYAYNGKNHDGLYGTYPPAQSVTFLKGPYMDIDGIDNPNFDPFHPYYCNDAVNGTNFGNGIIDDERYGMTRFISFNNSSGIQGDPTLTIQYYNYMRGIWKDGTKMVYGGNGHYDKDTLRTECNFMYPGKSDTNCYWGTGGKVPHGPVNWTEETAYPDSIQPYNYPGDRRGLGVSGPFTIEPGNYNEFELAYVFARNFKDTNNRAAISIMQERIDSIRNYFNDYHDYKSPCSNYTYGINDLQPQLMKLSVSPNPVNSLLVVSYALFGKSDVTLNVYDITGRTIITQNPKPQTQNGVNKTTINVAELKAGIYFLKLTTDNASSVAKFVKN